MAQRVLGVDASATLDREEDRAVDGVANRLGQEELGGLNLKELDDEREGDEAQRGGGQQDGAALQSREAASEPDSERDRNQMPTIRTMIAAIP